MYQRARSEAIGKARELRRNVYEIADIAALKYNLSEKQRIRLRREIVTVLSQYNEDGVRVDS